MESSSADMDNALSYEGEYKSDNRDAIDVDDQISDEHRIGASMTEADINSENQSKIISFKNIVNSNNADSNADAQAPSRRPATQYPRRNRKPPSTWFMAASFGNTVIATGDEPTFLMQ